MTVAVPVVWLDTAKTAPSENVAAVDAWARSRGLRLTGFASDDRLALPYPDAAVARVEAELDRAREAIAALDGPTADAALGRAEGELFAHPEVPQSAWLLAEILRARAARSKTIAPESPAAAAAALAEAKRLDGGRMAGLAEPPDPEGDDTTPLVDVAVEGEEVGALRIDGTPSAQGNAPLRVRAGRHHAAVFVAGKLAYATWFVAAPGSHLTVPQIRVPCSRSDLAAVRLEGSRLSAERVRCDDWVAARRGASSLFVARCHRDGCGPLAEWRVLAPTAPLVPRYEDRRVPAWATWGAIGAVTLVVATVVLVGSGALESPPESTRFSYGGVVSR